MSGAFRLSISPFHWYRLTAVPVLSLFILHFAVYKKLPFQAGYAFPWLSFGILLTTGYLICQCNCEVYRLTGGPKLAVRRSPARILRQFAYGWLITALVFSLTYYAQWLYFRFPFDLVKYSGYLALLLGISSLESSALILRDFYGFLQRKKSSLPPPIAERSAADTLLNIPSGKKMLRISADEVAFVHSTGGIVTFHTFRGQKITSDYNALDEVESSLIHAPFFRLNRQYLVHRDAIRRIAEAENRKFDVTIQPNGKSEEQFSVPVSRYRARDFKNWFYRSEPAFN